MKLSLHDYYDDLARRTVTACMRRVEDLCLEWSCLTRSGSPTLHGQRDCSRFLQRILGWSCFLGALSMRSDF